MPDSSVYLKYGVKRLVLHAIRLVASHNTVGQNAKLFFFAYACRLG